MEQEEIEVYLHHQTYRAYLVSNDGSEDRAAWVPKSQCSMEFVRKHRVNGIWKMTAPHWLLNKAHLI